MPVHPRLDLAVHVYNIVDTVPPRDNRLSNLERLADNLGCALPDLDQASVIRNPHKIGLDMRLIQNGF